MKNRNRGNQKNQENHWFSWKHLKICIFVKNHVFENFQNVFLKLFFWVEKKNLNINIDVKNCQLSISGVFRLIPAFLPLEKWDTVSASRIHNSLEFLPLNSAGLKSKPKFLEDAKIFFIDSKNKKKWSRWKAQICKDSF